MSFSGDLTPYSWVWWCAAFIYNPAVAGLQQIAPAVKPWRGPIRQAWAIWNMIFTIVSLFGFFTTVK